MDTIFIELSSLKGENLYLVEATTVVLLIRPFLLPSLIREELAGEIQFSFFF